MPRIFLSYRRSDAPDAAGRILDRLRSHFGAASVFFDIDSVPAGIDIRTHIDEQVSQCDVLIAIMGEGWLEPGENGEARIFNEADFVRIEIESALARGIPVIPIPVETAEIPDESELPTAISDLVFRNAMEVRSGSAFEGHMKRLLQGIEAVAKPGLTESSPNVADEKTNQKRTEQDVPGHITRFVSLPEWMSTICFTFACCLVITSNSIIDESENIDPRWFAHMDYWLLPIAAWLGFSKSRYIWPGYSLAVGGVIAVILLNHFMRLDFLLDIRVNFFIAAFLICWYSKKRFTIQNILATKSIQPVTLVIVFLVLGLELHYYEFENLDIHVSTDPVIILLSFFIGTTLNKPLAITMITVIAGLCTASYFATNLADTSYLYIGDMELGSNYAPMKIWHCLMMIFLGWAVTANQKELAYSLNWLARPFGFSLLVLLSLLNLQFEILQVKLSIQGSVAVGFFVMLVFGWFDARKAQLYGLSIATLFSLAIYGSELATSATNNDVIEEIIVSRAYISELWSTLDIWMLPVMGYLGGLFENSYKRTALHQPTAETFG